MTAEEHRQKFIHNDKFAEMLLGGPDQGIEFLDWIVTALYYIAVHKVDQYLASLADPQHPSNHEERRRLVRSQQDLRVVEREYRWLEDRSRDARYQAMPFQPQQVRTWKLNQLGKLRTHLDRRIASLSG